MKDGDAVGLVLSALALDGHDLAWVRTLGLVLARPEFVVCVEAALAVTAAGVAKDPVQIVKARIFCLEHSHRGGVRVTHLVLS